jgi:hypothetical protein
MTRDADQAAAGLVLAVLEEDAEAIGVLATGADIRDVNEALLAIAASNLRALAEVDDREAVRSAGASVLSAAAQTMLLVAKARGRDPVEYAREFVQRSAVLPSEQD